MRPLGVLIGGELYTSQGMRMGGDRTSETRAVATSEDINLIELPSMDGVDEVVMMLARIVKLAQRLNATDQRRIREFVEAARATLFATTRLDSTDQQAFEAALRHAASQRE